MIVDSLKNSILESAFSGKITLQNETESASTTLISIIENKKEYLKSNNLKDNNKYNVKHDTRQIPDNWIWTSIGELCFVTKLAGFEYTKYIAPNLSVIGEIPVVRAQNIKPNKFIKSSSEFISLELSKQLYRCALDCKCTLMTFIGAGIGESAVFDEKERYHLAPNVAKIVPGMDINKYLMYYFMSPSGKKNIFQYIKQTAQPCLSMETIRSISVPLAPLEEQKRIVDKIENIFSKLDAIKPIEDSLINLRTSFPNNMKKSILKSFYDGNYSLIPFCEWENDNLYSICSCNICTGNSISENVKKSKYLGCKQGYNYIATKDLEFNHTFNYDNGVKIPFSESKFKTADENDILMCIEGGSAGKKIGILTEKVCYGNKLCKFSAKKVLPKFLYYFLQSPQFINNFNDNLSGIIGGVSISKIKKINMSFPNIKEQQKMVNKIEEILPLCDDIDNLVKK